MLLLLLLALLALSLLVWSGIQLFGFFQRSRQTKQLNSQIGQIYMEAAPRTAEATAPPMTQPTANESIEVHQSVPNLREERRKEFQYIGDTLLPEAAKMLEQNPDYIGWLKIPGILNLPVVYRDNSYYLDHDFYGRYSDAGTLFLDVQHPLTKGTQYLMIHGHSMNDGSMLGLLTHYRRTDYIREHPYLCFDTPYRQETYEIFGVLYCSEEELYDLAYLGTPAFFSDRDFESFIDGLRSRALHFTPEEVSPDDAILACSTCYKDQRIVVFFRRITPE